MVCLIFHTVIIIHLKNLRITIKLHFKNLSIFLKKNQTYAHARTPPLTLFVVVRFSMTLQPLPLLNKHTFGMVPYEKVPITMLTSIVSYLLELGRFIVSYSQKSGTKKN